MLWNSIVKHSQKNLLKLSVNKWITTWSKDIILCLIAIKTITGTTNIMY
jgi:hypothetical protein